jgi:inner membrane protein
LIGETAARLVRDREGGLPFKARRNIFASLMVIGSNLPDSDFLYSIATRSKLDYLLQHRGYTHTVVGVVVEAILMFLVCELWIRRRKLVADSLDRAVIFLLALLGPLIHISMDATNTFGVHPFWPFDARWSYGDSIFIIEPLLWAAAVPLLFTLRTPWGRAMGVVLVLTSVTWIFSTGMITMSSGAALLALTVIMLAVGYFAVPRKALIAAMGVWAAITATFIQAHGLAQEKTSTVLSQRFPHAKTLDQALSPMPANPVCWEVVTAQVEGDSYAMRRAMLSLAPSWMPADRCPQRRLNDPTTVLVEQVVEGADAYHGPNRAQWKWYGELVISRSEFARLAKDRCEVGAFMRFARIPFAERIEGQWIVGDFRYDREPELSFGEFELGNTQKCPAHVPPWVPPRAELLQ